MSSHEPWPKKKIKENSKPPGFHLPLLNVHHPHPRPHICLGQILLSSPLLLTPQPSPVPAISSASGSPRWRNHGSPWVRHGPSPTQTPPVGPERRDLLSFGRCMVSSSQAPLLCYPSPSPLPLSHFVSTNFGLNLVPEASLPFTPLASTGMGSAQTFSLNCKKKKKSYIL